MITKEQHIERILMRSSILCDKKIALSKFYEAAYALPVLPVHAHIWEEYRSRAKEVDDMWKDHERDVAMLAEGNHSWIRE